MYVAMKMIEQVWPAESAKRFKFPTRRVVLVVLKRVKTMWGEGQANCASGLGIFLANLVWQMARRLLESDGADVRNEY